MQNEPAASSQQPAASSQQPAASSQQPAASSQQPAANKPLLIFASGKSKKKSGAGKNPFRSISALLPDSFPIVGAGVSVGGLEAFAELLKTSSRQQKLLGKHAMGARQ